jgi:hypothetical protein
VTAPVTIASENTGTAAPSGPDGGDQTAEGSTGAAQAGGVDVTAPVTIASEDTDSAAPGSNGGGQSAEDSTGAVQLADIDLTAPVTIAGADLDVTEPGPDGEGGDAGSPDSLPDEPAGTVPSAGAADTSAPAPDGDATSAPDADGTGDEPGSSREEPGPAPADPESRDAADMGVPSRSATKLTGIERGVGVTAATVSADGILPFTGMSLAWLLLAGPVALALGAGLRRVQEGA